VGRLRRALHGEQPRPRRREKGVRYTADHLEEHRPEEDGHHHPQAGHRQARDLRVAFLAYTYGTNGLPEPFPGAIDRIVAANMKKDIRAAKRRADMVVVFLHIGSEYTSEPEPATRDIARYLIRNGAGLVLGSHPHVVRPVEMYKGRYIVYSMGNFISDQNQPMTDLGIMVRANVTKSGGKTSVTALKVIPVFRDRSPGNGGRTFRTVLVDRSLSKHDALISSRTSHAWRTLRAYCKDMFEGYY